jgi:hypothetical protein
VLENVLEKGWNSVILGYRPLELDSLEVPIFRDAVVPTRLVRGYEKVRNVTRNDDDYPEIKKYPVLDDWGYGVMNILAEKHFGRS